MPTRWIVVADSSRARIFANSNDDGLIEQIAEFGNPSGRSNDSELASYTPGEGARPGPRTATQEDSAADHAVKLFSKNVAQYLDKARAERRYDRLYLIAAAGFLGSLREDLTPEVQKLVANELDKNISWFNERDIASYVNKAL
jgi:protein required for attachment to host cells